LKPLEVEIIQKWINEDHFEMIEIKRALLDAVQANKFSMSYVDSILIKRKNLSSKKDEVVYKAEKSEALKSFYNSWDQK
jgi:DNA replication protein